MKELLNDAMLEVGIDAILRNHVLNRMETTRDFILHNRPKTRENKMTSKIASAIYGLATYAVGMASLVYIGLWLIDLFVPNALDAPAQADPATGLAINLVLVIAFGLRQVWLNIRGTAYTHLPFQTPGLYKHIRHPLYVGWFTVMWAAPTMTISHLIFALMVSVYIFLAIQWEEADLTEALPEYRRYKATTPMLIPGMEARAASLKAEPLDQRAA